MYCVITFSIAEFGQALRLYFFLVSYLHTWTCYTSVSAGNGQFWKQNVIKTENHP